MLGRRVLGEAMEGDKVILKEGEPLGPLCLVSLAEGTHGAQWRQRLDGADSRTHRTVHAEARKWGPCWGLGREQVLMRIL